MYEWLLIISTHVYNGSVVTMERFATENECKSVKKFFIDSDKNNGTSIEKRGFEDGKLDIACMKVKTLKQRADNEP